MSKKTAPSEPAPKSTPPARRSAAKPPPIPGAKPPSIPGAKPPPIPGVKPPSIPGAKPPPIPSAAPAPQSVQPKAPPSKGPPRPSSGVERSVAFESLGASLTEMRAVVAAIADEVDRARANERGLSPEGEAALASIALRLRGVAGVPIRKGPPPLPPSATSLAPTSSLAPASSRAPASPPGPPRTRPVALSTLDISEMAELVESLVPPPPSGVDDDWT